MSAALAVVDPVLLAYAEIVGPAGPVAVRGGGTRWSIGGELADDTRVIGAPTGVVAHVPDEMIVTVRTGTSVAELHAVLAEHNQRTALAEREGGTVGGAIAVGESSLHRLGRGHGRDVLLQARYVSSDGRLVTAGGPTVKNVSGFDLCRLLVGSLGTLGLLAEVILRTQPIPPAARWLTGVADPQTVRALAPTASAVLWDGTTVWVHLEGHEADVAAAAAELPQLSVDDGPPPLPPHRWSLPPASVACLSAERDGPFVAEVGVGTVHASRPQPRPPIDEAVADLNRRVKAQFDPTGRLNPGRDPQNR